MLHRQGKQSILFLVLCVIAHVSARADNINYILTARQTNLLKNMDRISDVVANANTTGFKTENDIFTEIQKSTSAKERLSFTKIGRTFRDKSQGDMIKTSRQLDVAINGEGYFMVSTPFGPMYTRNGNFMVDRDGSLTTQNGYIVSGPSGGQVTLTDKDVDISIKENGLVKSGNEERGVIGVFTFANENLLQRVGGGLYTTSQTPNLAEKYKLAQGVLENSNVNSVKAMTDLVTVSRNIENMAKLTATHDEMQLDTIKRLTQ
jgi:flagellar basal-body rod protein FlgF